MRRVREIATFLEGKAPLSWQESYDNAGFLVGNPDDPVKRILVALDITLPVIEEAEHIGASLIVSHHPVIFQPVRQLTGQNGTEKVLGALLRKGISAICMHTNLDAAPGGVNDLLAEAIGLTQIGPLLQAGVREEDGSFYGIGRIGVLEQPMDFFLFAELVKERLHAGGLRFHNAGKPVFQVAVGGGSCGSLLPEVIRLGCDTFITGDVKYDVFLEAAAMGIHLIDAGHYPTENLICNQMVRWLKEAFSDINTAISCSHQDVVWFL